MAGAGEDLEGVVNLEDLKRYPDVDVLLAMGKVSYDNYDRVAAHLATLRAAADGHVEHTQAQDPLSGVN